MLDFVCILETIPVPTCTVGHPRLVFWVALILSKYNNHLLIRCIESDCRYLQKIY